MERISKHEFVKNTSRYLSAGRDIVVTHRGADAVILRFVGNVQKMNIRKDGPSLAVSVKKGKLTHYGCGCEKKMGNYLCLKHGRA